MWLFSEAARSKIFYLPAFYTQMPGTDANVPVSNFSPLFSINRVITRDDAPC